MRAHRLQIAAGEHQMVDAFDHRQVAHECVAFVTIRLDSQR
jgi:hypothetical protein